MASTPAHETPVLIAIDIETGGDSPATNPLFAVGVCVGTTGGCVVERRTWCFGPVPWAAMSPFCEADFWSKHADVLARIQAEAKPFDAQIRDFVGWFDAFDARPVAGLVTNNPAFDLGFLDYVLLSRGARALPLRYSNLYAKIGREGFRAVRDPSQMAAGQGPAARAWVAAQADARCPATHWPEDDAENIYWRWVMASRIAAELEKSGAAMQAARASQATGGPAPAASHSG